MGLIQRENGYFYVKIMRGGVISRFSLKTNDPELARDLYRAYLISLMQYHVANQRTTNNETAEKLKVKPAYIKPVADEYLEICALKKYTAQTMGMKRSLQKPLKLNHIRVRHKVAVLLIIMSQ